MAVRLTVLSSCLYGKNSLTIFFETILKGTLQRKKKKKVYLAICVCAPPIE